MNNQRYQTQGAHKSLGSEVTAGTRNGSHFSVNCPGLRDKDEAKNELPCLMQVFFYYSFFLFLYYSQEQ